MCSATENPNRGYGPARTSTIIAKRLHYFSSHSSNKCPSLGPCSLAELGLFLLSRLGTDATDATCLQDQESFLLAIATADSYQLPGDASKPTAFCTTRSPKYLAKAVKYSCFCYRLTTLCTSFSKFNPQT